MRLDESDWWHCLRFLCCCAHLVLNGSNRVTRFRVMKQELKKGKYQEVNELLLKFNHKYRRNRNEFGYSLFWKHSGLAPVGKKHHFYLLTEVIFYSLIILDGFLTALLSLQRCYFLHIYASHIDYTFRRETQQW